MESVIPKELKKAITDGYVTETMKVCLLLNTYVWADTHSTYADVSTLWEHPTGGGYTAGGEVLAGDSSTYSGTDAMYDANDTAWTTATLTNVAYAVVYDSGSGNIRAILDLGGSFSVVNGVFTLQWSANGIVKVIQS